MSRWALLLVVIACRRVPERASEPGAESPRPQLWVDASAAADGDGGRAAPLQKLTFEPGTTTHVATGLYPFSGALPEDAELVGEGRSVVLYADGAAPTVLETGNARVKNVSLQGAQWGVHARGALTLEDVSFSGQRQGGVQVALKARLQLSGGRIEGTVSETRGVQVLGKASLKGVAFSGALRRAVDVLETGSVTVEDAVSEGPAEAVHVSGGTASVTRMRAIAGRGPAFFASTGGKLVLTDVTVKGHEYAVLTASRADVRVTGLDCERTQIAGLGLVASTAVVKKSVFRAPGNHGAVEAIESTTTLEDVEVRDAADQAVMAKYGSLKVSGLRVSRVSSDGASGGDAVMLRSADATLEHVEAADLSGTGVWASAVSTVKLDDLRCTRCRFGALVVERGSKVTANRVFAEDSKEAAVSVPDEASLELTDLEVKGDGPALWADCAGATKVVLRGKVPPRALLSGRCLELPPERLPPGSKK